MDTEKRARDIIENIKIEKQEYLAVSAKRKSDNASVKIGYVLCLMKDSTSIREGRRPDRIKNAYVKDDCQFSCVVVPSGFLDPKTKKINYESNGTLVGTNKMFDPRIVILLRDHFLCEFDHKMLEREIVTKEMELEKFYDKPTPSQILGEAINFVYNKKQNQNKTNNEKNKDL